MTTRWWRAAAAVLCIGGCASDASDDAEPADAAARADVADAGQPDAALATLPALRWELAWDTSGIEASGTGWRAEGEDGRVVEVTGGVLTTYGGQWIECESAALAPPSLAERLAAAARAVWIGTAWAGHSGDSANATTVEGVFEELGSRAETQEWAAASVAPVDYCRVHYLVARADDSVAGWNGRPDMDRVTLRLSGRWYDADGAGQPFEVETSSANGVFLELDAGAPVDGGAGPFVVTIVRDARAWLLGVDWQGTEPDDLGPALLSSLMRSARVEVAAE